MSFIDLAWFTSVQRTSSTSQHIFTWVMNAGSIIVPQLLHRALPSFEEHLHGCKGYDDHILSISKRRICWKENHAEMWVKSKHLYLYSAFTVDSVSKQLYRDNKKIMQQSLFPEENSVTVKIQWWFIFVEKSKLI